MLIQRDLIAQAGPSDGQTGHRYALWFICFVFQFFDGGHGQSSLCSYLLYRAIRVQIQLKNKKTEKVTPVDMRSRTRMRDILKEISPISREMGARRS